MSDELLLNSSPVASAGTAGVSRRLLLASPDDEKFLSAPVCHIRSQIEVFAATPSDVQARAHIGGMISPPTVGRVGIRCIHCADVPAKQRSKGASSYPNSIRLVFQAVRNWQRNHLPSCEYIPADVRAEFGSFKKGKRSRARSKKESGEYWIDSCERLGMVDTDDANGIRFKDSVPPVAGIATGRSSLAAAVEAKTEIAETSNCSSESSKPTNKAEEKKDDPSGDTNADLLPETSAEGIVSEDPIAFDDFSGDIDLLGDLSFDFSPDAETSGDLRASQGTAQNDKGSNAALLSSALKHGLDHPEEANSSVPANLYQPNMTELQLQNVSVSDAEHARGCAQDEMRGQLIRKVQLAYDIVKVNSEMRKIQEPGLDTDGNCSSGQGYMYSLGLELYELFAGCQPFNDGVGSNRSTDALQAVSDEYPPNATRTASQKKKQIRSIDGNYIPLSELGLPTALSNLVSSLLGINSERGNVNEIEYYQTPKEVEDDLFRMRVDPDRYLFDARIDAFSGELDIPRNRLYGKDEQVLKLMNVCERVIGYGGPREVLLVSGLPGTGKSFLAQKTQNFLAEKGGYFMTGKFDALRQVEPLSAIVAAFNGFCDAVLERDELVRNDMKTAIKNAVGSDGRVLTNLIPSLCKVIGESNSMPVILGGEEAQNRLIFFIRKFLRAISGARHPVVFFLDDLQWADEASLELLRMIAADPEMSSLLLLGCYRDNEVMGDHPLRKQLANISSAGTAITEIQVGNMDRTTVNMLISDTLHLSPHQTQNLSDLVYNKTCGSALFVVQFLMSLYDEGLLHFSLTSRRWQWDIESIRSKNIAENVVELMTYKMLRLPPDVLLGLNKAACLGSQCDESTVKLLDTEDTPEQETMAHQLDIAVREGLMHRTGSLYKFSHDQIQHAAYSLIAGNEFDALHLQIGRHLWKRSSTDELNNILYVVADQLSRGVHLITDIDEKNELAGLFLMAGKKAMSSSAFLPASIYLLHGTELLDDGHWSTHYNLALEMFTCCAETLYGTGNIDGLQVVSNLVFANGRSLQDKLRVYHALISALHANGKGLEAIKCGRDVLQQLGESLPVESDDHTIVSFDEFAKARAMLQHTTIDAILHKEMMTDENKKSAMQLLGLLSSVSFNLNQRLAALITFRMVQISLQYGLSKESPSAFTSLAMAFIRFGDFEEGHLYGKLALSMMKRFNDDKYLPGVYATVYGFINIFTEPVQATLPQLEHANEVAMSQGNAKSAADNAALYVVIAFQSGRKLEPLLQEAKAYSAEMNNSKQGLTGTHTLVYIQAMMNLMGRYEDPTLLTGEAMDQDKTLQLALETGNMSCISSVYFLRMCLAYMFKRYDLAAEMAERRQNVCKSRPQRPATLVNETFYTGLIGVVLSRESGQSEWRSIAHGAREKLRAWAKHSSWNFQHKLDLLHAEIAYLNGDIDDAARAYNDAIRIAGEHGFVNEQALACERAGIFYSQTIGAEFGREYFLKAHEHYAKWGATRKASDILEQLNSDA